MRRIPEIKPTRLIIEALDRREEILSHDQTYRAKIRVLDLTQGDGMDQFTHLRGQELFKSNPNSNVMEQYSDFDDVSVFERFYVCLEACKYGFLKCCSPL